MNTVALCSALLAVAGYVNSTGANTRCINIKNLNNDGFEYRCECLAGYSALSGSGTSLICQGNIAFR